MNTYYIGGMPVTDELYHHGIFGMKWGVRRYQNPDGTLTPAGMRRYGHDPSKGKIIPKGTQLYRTTVGSSDATNGHAYLSYNDVDRDHYNSGTWLKNTSGADHDADVYEHGYKLLNDVRIADTDNIRDAYEKYRMNNDIDKAIQDERREQILNNDDRYSNAKANFDSEMKYANEHRGELGEKKYNEIVKKINSTDGKAVKQFAKEILNESGKITKDESFYYFTTLIGKNEKVRNGMFAILGQEGFDAMMDIASKGNSNVAEGISPMILFDRVGNLQSTGTKRINTKEQLKAGNRYNKWQKEATRALINR